MPRASSASAIMLPSSAPSVSSFEATTTGRAAAGADTCSTRAANIRAITAARRRINCGGSERDREQRVDLAAVEHDILAREPPAGFAPRGIATHDPVDIAAGSEQGHRAVLHRAHDDKTCFRVE